MDKPQPREGNRDDQKIGEPTVPFGQLGVKTEDGV